MSSGPTIVIVETWAKPSTELAMSTATITAGTTASQARASVTRAAAPVPALFAFTAGCHRAQMYARKMLLRG